MKPPIPNPSRIFVRIISKAPALLLLPVALVLTGCFSVKVHTVRKTIVAPHILDADLDQLITQMNARYTSIQTVNATVEITASTGGEHEGEIKEIPAFAGYIFLRKPQDLRILLLVPVIRSRALDMVSDGKTFKLLIPSRNRAITGSDEIVDPPVHPTAAGEPGQPAAAATSGLESLRPNIVRDALLVPALAADEFVTLTQHSRILAPGAGANGDRKDFMEEPDYDLTVLRRTGTPAIPSTVQTVETVRVIHIGRINLRPYQQDIYDHKGRVVTEVYYTKYAKSGDIDFPMKILIKRPIDEYTLNIDFNKLQLNTQLDDEQFLLKIPEGVPIQKMN